MTLSTPKDGADYVELETIGSGAYGVVMKGKNKQTGEVVALKRVTIRMDRTGIPQSVVREISILKRCGVLEHPNIVRLLDVIMQCVGQNDIQVSLVFEYCPCDLSVLLRRVENCPLPKEVISKYGREILNGILFLHQTMLVHRDIKPQNILLGSQGQLKLSDFGLARLYSSASLSPLVVTLWYRPPEVLLQCSYTTAVDIWSFGCILAEMCTLKPLFPGDSEIDQLRKIISCVDVPPDFEWPYDAPWQPSAFEDLEMESNWPEKICTDYPEVMDILEQTLCFLPEKRSSAQNLMRHRFFLS